MSRLDFMVLVGIFDENLAEDHLRFTDEGAEHLSGFAILEAVETAP
ncbi:hypothetical protein ACWJKU_13770 [Methylocaldum sp. MU1018]